MNETKAISLCIRHRDPRGFEFLFRQYRKEAYYHAFNMLGSGEEAMDACQEAFEKAYKAMPSLEKLERFYPWFYVILRNLCLNIIGKRRDIQIDRAVPDGVCSGEGTEAGAVGGEIRSVLGKLKHEFREMIVLRHIEGRSYDEISALLGIPRGTVMSRLYHARLEFRRLYSGNGEEDSHGL